MNTMETKEENTGAEAVLAIGSYWIKGDFAVRITGTADGGERGTVYSIEYVQPPTGASIQGGGASFYWDRSAFTPITDAFALASAKGHAALHSINESKAKLRQAENDYSTWCKVVGVMLEANRAAQS